MDLTSSISVHRGVTPPHGNQCFYHSWARELPLKFFPWPLKKFDPLEKSSWPPPKSWTYYVGRPCVCTDAAKSGGIFFRGVYSKLFIPGVFILVTTKNMLWLYEFNLGQHQAPVKWPSHYIYLFIRAFIRHTHLPLDLPNFLIFIVLIFPLDTQPLLSPYTHVYIWPFINEIWKYEIYRKCCGQMLCEWLPACKWIKKPVMKWPHVKKGHDEINLKK